MNKLAHITHKNIYFQTSMFFMHIADMIIKYMDYRFYHELKISFIKYNVLRALVYNKGTMKHSELASWTNTRKHNITTLVYRMKKDELVTTEWSQIDKRVNNVSITDKGRQLYKQANLLAQDTVEQMLQGINDNDAQEAERMYNIIKTNLERFKLHI